MKNVSTIARASLAMVLLIAAQSASAGATFPALNRAAMAVRSPKSVVLEAVANVSERLVAAGEHGVIALSDDSGQSWRQAKSVPTSVTITALKFVGAKGWAVGHGGMILHTADRGETWVKQADGISLAEIAQGAAKRAKELGNANADQLLKAADLLVMDGPDKPLLALDFQDENHGFVIGAYNLMFETSNGGQTWTSAMHKLDNPKSLHLYSIRSEGKNVFVAGEQGILYRSEDSGGTFKPLRSPYSGSWFSMDIQGNKNVVVAGLRGNAYFSKDHGETWAAIDGPKGASILQVKSYEQSVLMLSQSGYVLESKNGEKMKQMNQRALPPTNEILPLQNGKLVSVGWAGVTTIPSDKAGKQGEMR